MLRPEKEPGEIAQHSDRIRTERPGNQRSVPEKGFSSISIPRRPSRFWKHHASWPSSSTGSFPRRLSVETKHSPLRTFARYLFPDTVMDFATGLTVRGLKPAGCDIFRTRPDWPWGPPSLLKNGYRISLPEEKATGAWR